MKLFSQKFQPSVGIQKLLSEEGVVVSEMSLPISIKQGCSRQQNIPQDLDCRQLFEDKTFQCIVSSMACILRKGLVIQYANKSRAKSKRMTRISGRYRFFICIPEGLSQRKNTRSTSSLEFCANMKYVEYSGKTENAGPQHQNNGFCTMLLLCKDCANGGVIVATFFQKSCIQIHFPQKTSVAPRYGAMKIIFQILSSLTFQALVLTYLRRLELNIFLDQSLLQLLANVIYANTQFFHCTSNRGQFY